MTPLILRPQPAADELAALLRRQGHTPVVCPLLSYLPGSELGALSDRLSQADIVISISVAAVHYASEQLTKQQVNWPQHCRYLAVGATTAAQWQQRCRHQRPHCPNLGPAHRPLFRTAHPRPGSRKPRQGTQSANHHGTAQTH